MGSIFNRGTRSEPNWYAKYKDTDGAWRMAPTKQPTKTLALQALADMEQRVTAGKAAVERPGEVLTFDELSEKWEKTLANRNATIDRARLGKHLKPKFGEKKLRDITTAAVLDWIDEQRAVGKIADPSIRQNLNLLSRFFSWAVERGHAPTNPVRNIPTGRRPRQSPRSDQPWLDDDKAVRDLFTALAEPVNLMFYLGNQSGLRTGEIAGLRLSDLGFLDDGTIRVRFSYDGPLKEDKNLEGKVKWVPAAEDAAAILAPWLARRRQEGAGPEDLLFVAPEGGCMNKVYLGRALKDVAAKRNITLTWYQATRHSFVSRNLSRGASLDEVSAAVGHSSPIVTRRYYDHFVRKAFSPTLRRGLGLGGDAKEE